MTEEENERQIQRQMLQHIKEEKVERLKRLNLYIKKGQIVFAGSSLMEQFPIYEFLQDLNLPYTIYNRGIGGLTTTEMLNILPETVYDLQPKALFLNIGTNDLNVATYSQEALIKNYSEILDRIEEHVPGIKIYLLAYYPGNPLVATKPGMIKTLSNRTNAKVAAASEAVKQLAESRGLTFLDLNAGITDEQGNLKAEYTIEGMHMYATGYKQVLDALLPVLEKIQ